MTCRARALALDRPPVDAALGGGRQQRELGRISRAGASALAQLRVAARGGRREQRVVVAPPQLAHRHHAGRQRPGLVGADDRRAAERLDRRQPADEHVARRHALDADRERDRDDRRQPLRHGGDRERHRRHEHLERRPAAHEPEHRRTATIAEADGPAASWLDARRAASAAGSCSSVAVASRCAIFPSSVAMPVAATSRARRPRRDRRAHEDAVGSLGQRRVRRHGRRSLLDRHALAGQRRLVRRERVRLERGARRRRRRRRPRARAGRPGRRPRRRSRRDGRRGATRARGAVSDRSASSAFSARYSWKKPTSALSTTIARSRPRRPPRRRNPDTTAAPSSSQISGLANCRASSRQRDVRCARWISLAPTSARRRRASSVERPDGSSSAVGSRRDIGRTLRRGVHTARPPDTDCGLSPHRTTPGPPPSPYPGARRTSPEGRR